MFREMLDQHCSSFASALVATIYRYYSEVVSFETHFDLKLTTFIEMNAHQQCADGWKWNNSCDKMYNGCIEYEELFTKLQRKIFRWARRRKL